MMSRCTRHASHSQQSCANVKAASDAHAEPAKPLAVAPELTEPASSDSAAALAASSLGQHHARALDGRMPSRHMARAARCRPST